MAIPHRWLIASVLLGGWTACSPAQPQAPIGSVQLGTVTDRQLNEISGLAASRRRPGILWAHNDGKDGRLYALSTNGVLLATFRLPVEVTDVEDIALGPGPEAGIPYVYLGDTGDNHRRRRSIRILRLPEPDPAWAAAQPARTDLAIGQADLLTLQYPDGAHDAEALLVDPVTGDLFVATKEPRRSRLYTASQSDFNEPGIVRLRFAVEVPCARVSAGDISLSGRQLILRREDEGWVWMRHPGETVVAMLSRPPRPARVVGPPEEPNGEAVAWHPEARAYYTVSEGKQPAVYFLPLPGNGP